MSEAGDIFNAMLRRDHAPASEPPSEERQRIKAVLREEAEAGDKQARADLRAMQIADGERRPPASADGGAGGERHEPVQTGDERMNETIREVLHEKRGKRWSGRLESFRIGSEGRSE